MSKVVNVGLKWTPDYPFEDWGCPELATRGAACFDIRALIPENNGKCQFTGRQIFRTGLMMQLPIGYGLFIFSRSGHGFKHGIRLANGVGVVDSDYRGEICVALQNDAGILFTVNHGDRIAQGAIIQIPDVRFTYKRVLSKTERGIGGYGSTGVV